MHGCLNLIADGIAGAAARLSISARGSTGNTLQAVLVGELLLGGNAGRADCRHPGDVWPSLSALTTGSLAVLVTVVLMQNGRNQFRTCFSRLSLALIVQGTLGWRRNWPVHPPAAGHRTALLLITFADHVS